MLPGVRCDPHPREGEPRQEDLDLGLVDLHASHQLADLSAFLVRGADPDITMVEPNTSGLDFQGLELPVLSRAEMLEQDWDLENSSRGKVGDLLPAGEEAAKRGREGEVRARNRRRRPSRGRPRSWWRRRRSGGRGSRRSW